MKNNIFTPTRIFIVGVLVIALLILDGMLLPMIISSEMPLLVIIIITACLIGGFIVGIKILIDLLKIHKIIKQLF